MISVIIPTYNRAGFIEEAVRSVLDQDYFAQGHAFEFVIIDDGSTDGTRDIIAAMGPEIRYVGQPHKGVSAARNRGLAETRGEFVAFLDSDDIWKPDKLSLQMRFMQAHPEVRLCCTEEIWFRNGVFVNPRKKHRKYSGWIFDKVLPLCLLSLSSALFLRRVFDEIGIFDEALPACEDYDLGIRLAQRFPITFLPQPLIVKRGGHPDQLSKKYWGMDRFRVHALEKALSLDLTPEQDGLVRKEIARKCRILINGFRKRDKHAEAERYREVLHKFRLKES